jgi:hypothetical protein
VTIGNRVETLEEKALKGNSLTRVTIPSSVTTLGEKAFEENKLTSLDIPSSVTTIELNAFNKNDLTRATFRGNYGAFLLSAITYCTGALGWTAGNTFFNGSVSLAPMPTTCPRPIPVGPLWLLSVMAGLLSLVAARKIRNG